MVSETVVAFVTVKETFELAHVPPIGPDHATASDLGLYSATPFLLSLMLLLGTSRTPTLTWPQGAKCTPEVVAPAFWASPRTTGAEINVTMLSIPRDLRIDHSSLVFQVFQLL